MRKHLHLSAQCVHSHARAHLLVSALGSVTGLVTQVDFNYPHTCFFSPLLSGFLNRYLQLRLKDVQNKGEMWKLVHFAPVET